MKAPTPTYTVSEAAYHLRISAGRVYQMITAGQIRATMTDNVYAIPKTEVARIKAQRLAALEAKIAKYNRAPR